MSSSFRPPSPGGEGGARLLLPGLRPITWFVRCRIFLDSNSRYYISYSHAGMEMAGKKVSQIKMAKPISREAIKATALALFRDKGVDSTSINEIVKNAGIAKGTFYLYFDSKDDLVNDVFEDFASDFFRQVVESNRDLQKIAPLAESLLGYFRKNNLFLVELRKNLIQHREYPYIKKSMSALSGIILHFLNVYEQYPIRQLDVYSEVLISTILDICHRLFIDKSIRSQNEATTMLEDFMKRFFNCEPDFFLAKK